MKETRFTDEEFARVYSDMNKVEYSSSLKCFQMTKGLRKAELTTIIAPYGSGKSTFVKSILCDLMKGHKRTLAFLSEEREDYYSSKIWQYFKIVMGGDTDKANEYTKNLITESAVDSKNKIRTVEDFILMLKESIMTFGVEAIVFDNVSTSFIFNLPIYKQSEAFSELKQFAVDFDVPMICVFHTTKGFDIYEKILTGEDVKGHSSSTNIGSYNYTLMTFFRLKKPRAFVVIDKARYHGKANKKVFELNYDEDFEIFTSDSETTMETVYGIQNAIKTESKKCKVEIQIR
jgi:energy-coupling factor transporter ATP-binding protein EcfA2